VPLRQWVLSLPRRVRFLAARHPVLASRLLDVFTRAAFAWQTSCARRSPCTAYLAAPMVGSSTG